MAIQARGHAQAHHIHSFRVLSSASNAILFTWSSNANQMRRLCIRSATVGFTFSDAWCWLLTAITAPSFHSNRHIRLDHILTLSSQIKQMSTTLPSSSIDSPIVSLSISYAHFDHFSSSLMWSLRKIFHFRFSNWAFGICCERDDKAQNGKRGVSLAFAFWPLCASNIQLFIRMSCQ